MFARNLKMHHMAAQPAVCLLHFSKLSTGRQHASFSGLYMFSCMPASNLIGLDEGHGMVSILPIKLFGNSPLVSHSGKCARCFVHPSLSCHIEKEHKGCPGAAKCCFMQVLAALNVYPSADLHACKR